MADRRASLLQGTLDLLILKALSASELHDLGVSRRIRADHRRYLRDAARFALSRPASPRGSWLARLDLGCLRQQPARQVLHADQSGTAAVGRGDDAVEPDRPGHRSGS